MKHRRIGRLLAVVAMGWVAGAQAADVIYTFNVPVDLRSLAEEARPDILCEVFNSPTFTAANRLHFYVNTLPIGTGGESPYSSVVSVPVTLTNAQAMDAHAWRCRLRLNHAATRTADSPSCATLPQYCAKTGTTLVNEVSGSLDTPVTPSVTRSIGPSVAP
ncbi:MAG: hypothetical protein Q8O33_16855 [Pseudomonadota bacterium]|nr:hypothetical protein [Pseudomonadota bacterium]